MYLRSVRLRRRLTQAQLSEKSGIAQNTISKLERRAMIRPGMATVRAIARVLDVDPLKLQWGPDPRKDNGLPIDLRRRQPAPAGARA